MTKPLFLLLILVVMSVRISAHTTPVQICSTPHDTLPDSLRTVTVTEPGTVTPDENFKKKKLIASILAFPIPFGFSGLHRIYLGSEPWVPVAYLLTGGGGFGLLPLLDFIFIVSADEEEFRRYENNPNLFMFAK
jgi:TM2 domain-containing membrane protein YozV